MKKGKSKIRGRIMPVSGFSDMPEERFESLVARAIEDLPPEFQSKLKNVDVVVEDWPTSRQLRQVKLKHP
ncbi:MAG: hypothetical protein GH152_02505, partial [Dehalococcoidia bacterium]|nr:hypothetical protein [Dehalococcoidia bacterium]